MTASARPAVVLAVSLTALVAGSWWWRSRVFHTAYQDPGLTESWDHVKRDYPLPEGSPQLQQLPADTAEAVVRANPFSRIRHPTPAPVGESAIAGGGAVVKAASPLFVYKGRINVGQRQRAIVEETTTHKTYFLEVGQEVAWFKVLDIAENRMVLSHPQTNQEVVVSLISSPAP